MPKVSPNKTVEGSLAGIAASIVEQFGDLAMGAVKRICGIKDFGKLLPGHGSILDRFDSHLFCVAYTLLYCLLTGGFIR